MATIKSYTDLSQSKTLSKTLPLESADMYFEKGIGDNYREAFGNLADMQIAEIMLGIKTIPCWSLAALLSVLGFPSLTQNKEDEWEVCVFDHDNDGYIEKIADNPVDACYEMIIKLHEFKML